MSESETLKEITSSVLTELASAESKYSWKNNNLIKQALTMIEEAGEVAQAVNNLDEKNGTIQQVRTELIQTAAMCFRMLKGLKVETCQKCKSKPSQEDHTCPYSEEINNSNDLCNCCPACAHECCMDI